ncbi:hypothetical protein ACQY0O_003904 [Thecaphora frezii]
MTHLPTPFLLQTDAKTHHTVRGSLGKPHFAIAPEAVAFAAPTSPIAKWSFAPVPRNDRFERLLPILSRLPTSLRDAEDVDPVQEAKVESQLEAHDESLEYVRGRSCPYTRSRLPRIDAASLELWKALHSFRPVTSDYAVGYLDAQAAAAAVAPHPLPQGIEASDFSSASAASQCPAFTRSRSTAATAAIATIRRVFNWHLLPLPLSLSGEWYGVIFRSARKAGSESTSFYEADRLAHEEAVASGGLLMYWYGSPDPTTGENLATCIWTSRDDAIRASKLELHAKAARFTRSAYDTYDLTRYRVRKVAGEERLRIEEWNDDLAP